MGGSETGFFTIILRSHWQN